MSSLLDHAICGIGARLSFVSDPQRRPSRFRVHRFTIVITALALLTTGVLAWTAALVNDHNETRLLRLKVAETGAVLQAAIPSVSTPLSSAAEIAQDSNGGSAGFDRYLSSFVGPKKTFAFAALWSRDGSRQLAMIGTPAPGTAAVITVLVRQASSKPGLNVKAHLAGPDRVLQYAYASPSFPSGPIVYAESPLPPKPRIQPTTGTPFSDLRFALYLGRRASPSTLLEVNTDGLGSRTSSVVVPFGDQALTVVAASNGSLAGGLSSSLWWIVAIAGGLLSLGAGGVAERLLRRRMAAEALTGAVQELLDRQQGISRSLQQAMVPPPPHGPAYLEVASRYVPGVNELEVGGDWFDVIELDENRTFVSIGDVSGRGISAGTVMASLRSAMAAFVSEGHAPGALLSRLGRLLDTGDTGRFATVCCLVVDRRSDTAVVASAGHLPALVVSAGTAHYLEGPVGPPIGTGAMDYAEQIFDLPRGATLLLFTDGLVERKGETIDDGLGRLSYVAARTSGTVDEVLTAITSELASDLITDDTAVLGVRLIHDDNG